MEMKPAFKVTEDEDEAGGAEGETDEALGAWTCRPALHVAGW